MAIKIQAMSFICCILLANLIFADAECDVFHQWYIFAKGAVEKFVPPKYQNLDCLAYVFRQPKAKCDIETLFLPISSKNCQETRQNHKNLTAHIIQKFETRFINNVLYANDFDAEEICDELLRFNQKPAIEKNKANYTEFYRSNAGYLPYAYVRWYFALGKKLVGHYGRCVLEANKEVRKFFGNQPPPKWTSNFNFE